MASSAQVTFVQPDGERTTIRIEHGSSVMEGAREHGIPGIEAICGGLCSCATCHCYLEAPWDARLGPAPDGEQALIDFAFEPRDNSRLTCQLMVDAELDGLVVHVPSEQL